MIRAAAGLKPVSRTTLSEQVAKQLASEIESGRWKPGEKLPSEADLCRVFNVGRSSLREALKSLSFIGLISIRAGGGSYVADERSKYIDRPFPVSYTHLDVYKRQPRTRLLAAPA